MKEQLSRTTKTILTLTGLALVVVVLGAWFVWTRLSAFREKGVPTVKGPDAVGMLVAMHHKIYGVAPKIDGGFKSEIVEINPQTRQMKTILTANGDVASLTEAHGKIAYMVTYLDADERHELHFYDGTIDKILKSWSSNFWPENSSDGIERGGNSLALSPDGKWLATVVRHTTQKAYDASDGGDGPLVLTNLSDGSSRVLVKSATDLGISWFPDSRKVVFVQAFDKGKAVGIPKNEFGIGMGSKYLSIASEVDVSTGLVKQICGGSAPLLSEDGTRLLVLSPTGDNCMLVALQDKSFVELPDTGGGEPYGQYTPIGLIKDAQIVALASPTRHGLADDYRFSLVPKIIDFQSHKFQTISDDFAGTVACYGN